MDYYYGKVEEVLPNGLLLCRFVGQHQRIKLKPESVERDETT